MDTILNIFTQKASKYVSRNRKRKLSPLIVVITPKYDLRSTVINCQTHMIIEQGWVHPTYERAK